MKKTIYNEGDLVNGVFFIKELPDSPLNRAAEWKCKCGNIFIRDFYAVLRKKDSTCNKGTCAKWSTHGYAAHTDKFQTSEYLTWLRLKSRCLNPKNPSFEHYGGRGIKVCERWLNSFENFIEDMGNKPSPKHSIERNENDGNYEPSNCRWATAKEQANNKRSNNKIEFRGEIKSITEWSKDLKTSCSGLLRRINKLGIEQAFNLPLRRRNKLKD